MNPKKLLTVAALTCAALISSTASAGLYTTNYGAVLPGYYANDDSSFQLTLPSTIAGFNGTNGQVWVDNNGLVYVPGKWTSYAFLWDLDSRDDPLGVASIRYKSSASEAVVTWDRMGLFSRRYDTRFTFQMVFRDNTIGFFYDGVFPNHCVGFDCAIKNNTGQTVYINALTGAQVSGFAAVPEPGSIALIGFGLVGLGALRKKKKQS